MGNTCIEIKNVNKHYQNLHAVRDMSFDIPTGSIFGLLGPNGAGKTSLIRMITAITRPDSGSITLNGIQVGEKTQKEIGYLPEERGLYKKMKVTDHIVYVARLKGMPKGEATQKAKQWLEKFSLSETAEKKVEELSKGMQQKVQFISTVIHEPPLLILDEPFSGLDPINTNLIRNEIYELKQRGVTIIFSTHRMEQVEEVCENIVVINKGQIVLEGSVEDIKQQSKENIFSLKFKGTIPDSSFLNKCIVKIENQEMTLKLDDEDQIKDVFQYLLSKDIPILRFEEVLPTLNEIFIKKVGQASSL